MVDPPSRAAELLGLGSEPAFGRRQTVAGVAAILLLAAALRLPLLDEVPAGLFCDEAADGYNAYSLLKTGRDEHGTLLPFFIPSFGSGLKNPAYVYAVIPPVALFGLDDTTVRLPAALYGVLAVLAIYLLGRTLFNDKVGMVAALLLALCPWHLHFSRIAFDLIALPTFFLFGLDSLLKGIDRGERRLFIAAGVLLGLTPYAYSIANVFVPLMLAAIVALYRRELWSRRQSAVSGLLAFLLTMVPLFYFKLFDPRDVDRFALIGIVDAGAPVTQILREFAQNYRQYLSFEFLFQHGDPIVRHSVRGFGENLLSVAPWFLIGLVAAFARARRGMLLVWWLLTYPVAAALVRETPSATRSIVGAPLIPLVGAIGLVAAWSLLGALRQNHRAWLRAALVVVAVSTIGIEAARYLRSYFVDYPKYSAPTYHGWQYGYRETIRFMEQHRGEFDRLVLTATEVNQPQIFALFYSLRDPREYHATGDPGYDIFIPEHYSQYDLDAGRMLFAANPLDTAFFEEYEVLHEVKAPGGEVVYQIIEPLRRKRFLDRWEAFGPLPPGLTEVPALVGETAPQWRPVESEFVYTDLDRVLGASDHVCAVAATEIVLEGPARDAVLECIGSEDLFAPTVGSQRLAAATLEPRAPQRFPVRLESGSNPLQVLSCEGEGDWYFACSVVDGSGRSLDEVSSRAPHEIEPVSVEASVAPTPPSR
jgi:4-amino-4-deoxy-L-arabinose transferase-like glycosyltransferase